MTLCNVCGTDLGPNSRRAFLCEAHRDRVPADLMARYEKACEPVEAHYRVQLKRRKKGKPAFPLPPKLAGKLSSAYSQCRKALGR